VAYDRLTSDQFTEHGTLLPSVLSKWGMLAKVDSAMTVGVKSRLKSLCVPEGVTMIGRKCVALHGLHVALEPDLLLEIATAHPRALHHIR
jgi:hypothetical protein